MFSIITLVNKLFKNDKEVEDKYRVALDIGTEFVKAMIVKFDGSNSNIIGYGRIKQDYTNMEGGAISNIEEVIKTCHKAIEKAEKMAEISPSEMVIGIAGEFVKGVITPVNYVRPLPKKRIKRKEIDNLVKKAQSIALKSVQKELWEDIGLEDVKVELVNSSVVEMKIDGYKVTNPKEFQGKNLEISVFNTFAPLVHVGSLETVATRLGYNLVGVIAEPFSIAKSIMNNEAYEFGAIVIDIGGGTTDIALIRNGGIEGTKMFGIAGRDFTKSLARSLNLTLEDAENLKLAYSLEHPEISIEKIKDILKADLDLLYEGIELSLKSLAKCEALPQKIYLCGGGSALKGLFDGIIQRKMYEDLPFFKKPEIKLLDANQIVGIEDNTKLLVGAENVTPKSLALQSTMIEEVKECNLFYKLINNLVS
ncbi:cell division FtsA domain-containing protein [Orenia marismortui]|uniref:Cell division protein FtsA n=1 Tax=Orenia marismortui TaxID=46469 RepID=A0A4R8GM70_9FIRM|nr:cell division FtsA domain-containing protein [Orenia marismortui]TDX46782.1 cell division protein FtsA [Orenia marismortui]